MCQATHSRENKSRSLQAKPRRNHGATECLPTENQNKASRITVGNEQRIYTSEERKVHCRRKSWCVAGDCPPDLVRKFQGIHFKDRAEKQHQRAWLCLSRTAARGHEVLSPISLGWHFLSDTVSATRCPSHIANTGLHLCSSIVYVQVRRHCILKQSKRGLAVWETVLKCLFYLVESQGSKRATVQSQAQNLK